RWARLSRTLSFWALVILIPVLFMNVLNPQARDQAEFTYSQFKSELAGGNIQEVTVVEGQTLEGVLRTPIVIQGRSVDRFTVRLPIRDSEETIRQLEAHDVIIDVAPPRQNWWVLVINMLPWILILGFWFFLFRQMQSGGNKAFQFGKSKARLLTGDTPKV